MKDLIKKYRYDSLSAAELDESRDKVDMMDDRQLDQVIYDDWKDSATEVSDPVSDIVRRKLKHRIDVGLGLRPGPWTIVWRVLRTACVIMLPLFIAATIIFYNREESLLPDTISVATRHGERSMVTLPDSSVVTLNGASNLTCCQGAFRSDERNINFTGEAYFNIYKDPDHPFVITACGLKVTVLGTKFNLEARPEADCATIYLDEGLVLLTSSLTGESVEVHPREKAVLNYADGSIALSNHSPYDNTLAWLSGKLVFSDEPLGNVFKEMKKYYGYTLGTDDESMLEARFTGTIPSDDMTMAVAVLEKAFGAHFVLTRIPR
ncbi:MAG: FecR domain-containing protein [Muribaculaceae bacterium]|nr:FecR domain-containing protein [Muribaculaceae bacterium]